MTKEQDEVLELRGRVAALEGALRGVIRSVSDRDVGRALAVAREALAAAVPPKSPDVELYEAQERFVDARRSAAVPQPPRNEPDLAWLVAKWRAESSDEPLSSYVTGSHDARRACARELESALADCRATDCPVGVPHTHTGPAVPQPPRDVADEAVETRAREAMVEPTSANKLSGRWEGPAVPQGEPHPVGWACNSCDPERGIRCASHKGEPTPAPQREPARCRSFGNYAVTATGDRCVLPLRHEGDHRFEAPPAGEPTPASPDQAALGLPSTVQECHAEILRLRADRALGDAPTVSREVDEAAVRASLVALADAWEHKYTHGGYIGPMHAPNELRAFVERTWPTERPAASGKEQGE